MSKNKLKKSELTELQEKITKVNEWLTKIGAVESQKFKLLVNMQEDEKHLLEYQKELEEEYGIVSVNIETGELTEIENE